MTTTITNCPHCGGTHGVRCPCVRAIEYYPDGAIKRIEYMTASDYLAPLSTFPALPPHNPWPAPPWPTTTFTNISTLDTPSNSWGHQ